MEIKCGHRNLMTLISELPTVRWFGYAHLGTIAKSECHLDRTAHHSVKEAGETFSELIDRAIREYPEPRTIALVGWREQQAIDRRDTDELFSPENVPRMSNGIIEKGATIR